MGWGEWGFRSGDAWSQEDDEPRHVPPSPCRDISLSPLLEAAGGKMALLVFPGFKFLGHTAQRLLESRQFLELRLGEPTFLLETSIPSRSMSVGDTPQK